jgi:acyl-CoA synthetase (AMP-forming)/AMP-acid ligase II
MNIVDPFLFHAKLNPAALAICTPGAARERVSYGRLAHMVNNVGRTALAWGLAPGQLVAIDVKDRIFHAALILGLARVGIATVTARGPSFPRELNVHAVICDATAAYRNAGTVIVADQGGWAIDGSGEPLPDQHDRSSGEDLCRVTLTSGTTGEAKGVAFSHRAVFERNARLGFVRGDRFPLCARFFCDLGMATDPGFRDMIHMLSKGGTIFYYGGDAESMIQAIGLYRIGGVIISPSGLAEYLKFFEAYDNVACGLDFILTSGASLSRSLSERVRARMCTNLYSTYGATETGGVAVAPAHAVAGTPGAVGFVAPGGAVEIVYEDGTALPAGREGSVRIRTPQMVAGYVGRGAESETAFRGGWFYPGDIGCMREDGMLVVLGRASEVLNLSGDKIRPELVEEAVASFPGIAAAAAFTVTDELGVARLCAAVAAAAPIDDGALRRHCEQRLGPAFAPVRFVRVDALPRTAAGKLDRRRLPELDKTAP